MDYQDYMDYMDYMDALSAAHGPAGRIPHTRACAFTDTWHLLLWLYA